MNEADRSTQQPRNDASPSGWIPRSVRLSPRTLLKALAPNPPLDWVRRATRVSPRTLLNNLAPYTKTPAVPSQNVHGAVVDPRVNSAQTDVDPEVGRAGATPA